MRALALASMLAAVASGGRMGPPAPLPAYISAADAAGVTEWLRTHPTYRLATDGDCACADNIAETTRQRQGLPPADRDYHPYYARGDFNHDGVVDTAFGVIGRDDVQTYAVLIIDGAAWAKKRRLKAWLGESMLLRQVMLFGPPGSPRDTLMVGPFDSEACLIVRSRFGGYRLDCVEE
jgi:hypothetical protein